MLAQILLFSAWVPRIYTPGHAQYGVKLYVLLIKLIKHSCLKVLQSANMGHIFKVDLTHGTTCPASIH